MGIRTAPLALIAGLLLFTGCGYQASHPSTGVTAFHFSSGTYVGIIVIPLILAAAGIAAFLFKRDDVVLKIFAIGGLSVGEPKEEMLRVLAGENAFDHARRIPAVADAHQERTIGQPEDARAEMLDLEQFVQLSKILGA